MYLSRPDACQPLILGGRVIAVVRETYGRNLDSTDDNLSALTNDGLKLDNGCIVRH